MKSAIKQDIKLHIITFVFLVMLSFGAIYILLTAKVPEDHPVIKPVSAIAVLDEGRSVPFGNNAGTLRLLRSTVSFPQCADCMETASVEVIKGNERRLIDFRFGGIAGFHEDTAKAFDYVFIMRELLDKSVVVEYEEIVNATIN